MPKLISELNVEQKKAVTQTDGPCLIIAGAGTGKTKVITHKIAHLIEKKLAKPSEILALTFTEKAASEMEERVDQLVPYGFVDTWISTFHAFGDRILRDFAIDLGLPANFKVLSKTEQAIFMRENLYSFDLNYYRPIANPASHIMELLNHFSRLKDELIAPSDYLRFAQVKSEKLALSPSASGVIECNSINQKGLVTGSKVKSKEDKKEVEKMLELAYAYERYQNLMLQDGNLDYGDQIFLTYKILKENRSVLKKCQKQFKYILVDEFQDTNFAQYQIVKLLAENNRNITVVGDDDQSIYRFRGASISNILSFKEDYPDCSQIVLYRNYRSTQQILDASYKLIQHNNPDRLEVKNKINKKLISRKQGRVPEIIHCDTLSCEADQVIKKIVELKEKSNFRYSDFAILARANSHLEPFINALNYHNIPNIFVGTSSLFKRPEIKMLISFFKCISYDDDNLSFYQLATSELYGIDENLLSKFYSRAKRENKSFENMFYDSQVEDIKVAKILSDIKKYRSLISKLNAGEILYEYLKEKKYFKTLTDQGTVDAEIKISNIAKFFDRIAQFDHVNENKSVLSFLGNLELILQVGDEVQSTDVDTDIDAVNLMTVHASKGLEWPAVFIVNMVSDRFPSRNRREKIPIPDELIKEKLPEGDFHIQEERRLFYVGATRAKEYLYFSSADDYGGKRTKKISQFVLEILDNSDLIKNKHKLSPLEKINQFDSKQSKDNSKFKIKNLKFDSRAILKLSRQQIDDYYTCPKKFYFSTIIKIPLPLNWHFMYGTAIHEAVGRYFQKKVGGQKPDLNSLIEDFEQSFISEGFITRQHEEERKRKGVETLSRFFDTDKKDNLLPYKVEERFEFSDENVKINGRYDLILKEHDQTIICDFKTSQVNNQKDADRRIRESTQMKIYALSWYKKFGVIPKTSLIFIESDLQGSRVFSEKELNETHEIISSVAKGIRVSNFTAKPDVRQCGLCSYKDICKDSLA